MEIKTDILDELRSLSPLIAGMKRVNVFTVPDGYFDSVSTTVWACLREQYNTFIVPENKQSTGVPAGYFDQLAASILGNIKAGETARDEIRNLSPLLYDIQNKNVFEVPAEYFTNLDKFILDKLATTGAKDELKELSPLLHSIRSKTVFEAPDGYFVTLPDEILRKVKPAATKVVTMPGRSFINYAVAAMLTGIMAVGIYKSVNKPAGVATDNRIVAAATLDASIEKGKSMNDKQFNEALAGLNDADIAKYLENNGDVTDVAALNNNLEDNNLPSQDDYLLDDAALENYLKEIEKTTVNN